MARCGLSPTTALLASRQETTRSDNRRWGKGLTLLKDWLNFVAKAFGIDR